MQIAIIEAVGIVKQCRAVLSFETPTILIDTNKQCPNFVLAKVVSIGWQSKQSNIDTYRKNSMVRLNCVLRDV